MAGEKVVFDGRSRATSPASGSEDVAGRGRSHKMRANFPNVNKLGPIFKSFECE